MKLGFPLANQLIKPHTCYKAGRHNEDKERSLNKLIFSPTISCEVFWARSGDGVLCSILCIGSRLGIKSGGF